MNLWVMSRAGFVDSFIEATDPEVLHSPLDTLVLAMPVSWKGMLQQYAGRLHRVHASKIDVQISDFRYTGHQALLRMWDKRPRGYRTKGYRVEELHEISEIFAYQRLARDS